MEWGSTPVNRMWTATVEIDFPIKEGDLRQIFDDDDYTDFIFRANERLKDGLESLRSRGTITHFRVVSIPHLLEAKENQ